MADVLEYPEGTPFSGVIGQTLAESQPAWPAPRRPPADAPNIVMIVLDDVGYAQLGCYGSNIDTPNIDRLAAGGIRFRNFHTTAMCSPTRACLLTGRNHHTNGLGAISELANGFPGYNGQVSKANGFLSEILLPHGYATFAVGKWHLAPPDELHMAARRDRWPLGRGFERYYGFIGAETNHWEPDLVSDNHMVRTPRTEGYHLSEDLADRAIEFVSDLRSADADKPFFLYFCPGAAHAPHHVAPEWADRHAGRFDEGWDAWREQAFAHQIESGLLPEGTELSARPPWIERWDDLSPDARRLYARMMEVFAGFLSHADHHIGRVIDFIEDLGELDNTIVMVLSDNGASAEGGPNGSLNENLFFNGVTPGVAENLAEIDALGGPSTYGHYPFGWAAAGNTPFKRWKRETHEGGTADPFIIHWPQGLEATGQVRGQYLHAIDVLPTLLDVLGLDTPTEIGGVAQSPIAGTSFADSLSQPDAPAHHHTQYFEQMGCRALYHRGWKAVTYHAMPAAMYDGVSDPFKPFNEDVWELYHVAEDFSECHDLATEMPEKLREMIDRWWTEAGRYDVLPLNNMPMPRAMQIAMNDARPQYVYLPGAKAVPTEIAVNLRNRAHTIVAFTEIPESGAEGVLLAHGGRFGGYALFVADGHLHFAHRHGDGTLYQVSSSRRVPTGAVRLGMEFVTSGLHQGVSTLYFDDEAVGTGPIERTVPVQYSITGEGLCCGYDDRSGVAEYAAPFEFTGTIDKVVVNVSGRPFVDVALEIERAFITQ